MDDRTLAALDASILHWEQNLAAETPDDVRVEADDCALCGLFLYTPDPHESCDGCPVFKSTGNRACGGTPYEPAFSAYCEWEAAPEDHVRRAVFRTHARAEIEFLRSLRPVGERTVDP